MKEPTLSKKQQKPSLRFKTEETTNSMGYPDVRATPEISENMEEAYLDTVSDITGTLNEMLGQQLIQQAIHASPDANEIDVQAEAVSAALGEMQPQDAAEGMIITQMVGLHNQMMYYMKRSIEEHWDAEEYLNRFLKINRQFLACLNGLLRYRNRGQQNVVVQNVNVGPDGKAIVGCVQTTPH
jgi:hypothetical protein